MKYKSFLLSLLLVGLIPVLLIAQPITFMRTYGTTGFEGTRTIQTSDGGYLIAGYTHSGNFNYDALLIKTDSLGYTQWTKTYGSSNYYISCGIPFQTMDGGYLIRVVCLSKAITSYSHDLVMKTDSLGNPQWTKFGITYINVWQTNDSGYVFHGGSFGVGGSILRTDKNLNVLWQKGFLNFRDANSRRTSDKGFIFIGSTSAYASGGSTDDDIYLIKTDSLGNMLWNMVFGGSNGTDIGVDVDQTADGGYIIAGTTFSFGIGNPYNIIVIKTDSDGNMQWSHTYGGTKGEMPTSIRANVVTGIGDYMLTALTGGIEVTQNGTRTILIRLNGAGTPLWSKMYGSMSTNPWLNDEGWNVDETKDGGFLFSGETWSMGAGQSDMWLVKTDASGAVAGCEVVTNPLITNPNVIVGIGGGDTSITPVVTSDSLIYIVPSLPHIDSIICTSGPVGVEEAESNDNEIIIYPNPTSGVFNVQVSGYANVQMNSIEVYNVLGEKIVAVAGGSGSNSQMQIDISNHPEGIYFVRVQTAEGMMSKKMVVVK